MAPAKNTLNPRVSWTRRSDEWLDDGRNSIHPDITKNAIAAKTMET
jgi:hypothetical protein